jgi:hypothetical protein
VKQLTGAEIKFYCELPDVAAGFASMPPQRERRLRALTLSVGQRAAAKMIGKIWRYAISDGVPRRSFVVALIVGTILNLINQGDAMLAGLPLDFAKLLLTYLVPYFVSTYGAVSYRFHADPPMPAR